MNVYISFKPHDFNRYVAALTRLETSVPTIADNMCRYGAIEYKTEVLMAFSTQNFVTRIPRLTKQYMKWKIEHGFSQQIGKLQGDLLDSLSVFRWWGASSSVGSVMKGWFGGVDVTKFDGGGKNWGLKGAPTQVAKYAIWLEEGNRAGRPDRQRPRPVFIPIGKRYAKSGYVKQRQKALDRIGQRWH